MEALYRVGFIPQRTIVLAFGMDEERHGTEVSSSVLDLFSLMMTYAAHQGGPAMRDYLLKTYGENGFAMLLDEGSE